MKVTMENHSDEYSRIFSTMRTSVRFLNSHDLIAKFEQMRRKRSHIHLVIHETSNNFLNLSLYLLKSRLISTFTTVIQMKTLKTTKVISGADKPISFRAPPNIVAFLESQPGTTTETILNAIREKMAPKLDPRIEQIKHEISEINAKLEQQAIDNNEIKNAQELILQMLQYSTST